MPSSLAPTFAGEVMLYDPVPMRLARLKNRERAQLLVESRSRPALQGFLAQLDGRALRTQDRRAICAGIWTSIRWSFKRFKAPLYGQIRPCDLPR